MKDDDLFPVDHYWWEKRGKELHMLSEGKHYVFHNPQVLDGYIIQNREEKYNMGGFLAKALALIDENLI